MREYEAPNTKLALVLAAGELFAEKGFDRTTTREIAEKSGIKLGSLHYHFGSKEALYLETFRYGMEKEASPSLEKIIAKAPERTKTPLGISHIVYEYAEKFIELTLRTQTPGWITSLIMSEIAYPSSAFDIVLEEIFQPDHEDILKLYHLAKPDGKKEEADIWAFILPSQAMFYNQTIAKSLLKKKKLSARFIKKIARTIAKMMILAVDLPVPEGI